ncbi:MAG: tetratricopeptide repeat protein [Vicinamibacterales bacterium]
MKPSAPSRCFALVLLAVALATGACTRKDAAFYEKSGDDRFRAGKFGEAAIQYLNALHEEPMRGDLHFKLADAWFAEGNRKAAYPEYIKAADLMPENAQAQNRAGFLLVRGGMFKEARDRARIVLQKDPNNAEALLVLGNALAGLRSLNEAEDVLKRAVEIDPERAGVYTGVAVMQLAQGELPEAEATFKRAVEVSKGSPDAYMALGNFYRVAKRQDEAEAALKSALAADPKNIAVHQTLAAFYSETNRPADAEEHLKTVMSITPSPDAMYALSDFYVAAGRQPEALTLLEKLSADDAQFAAAKVRISLIHFLAGNRPAAHAAVDEVLKKLPTNPSALTLKARLLLADGDPDKALESANAAVKADRQSAQAHLAAARILVAMNRLDEAMKEFRETLALDQTSLPAQLELADFHRRRNELETAIGYADQAIKTHPGNLRARMAKVEILLMRRDDSTAAIEEISRLVKEYPRSTDVQTLLGRYYLAVRDRGNARQAFERAMALGPSTEALTGLVTLDVADGNARGARARVDAALAKSPDSADLLLLGAKLYGVEGQSARAEQMLLKVVKVAPDKPAPYALLAQLYMAQARTDEAKAYFRNLVKADPRAVYGFVMLGVLEYATGNRDAAKTAWESALRLDAKNASAANNLAWLYAEAGTNLETAQQLAVTARNLLPEQPEINDTLGWIYYKKKLTENAIEYFRRAVERGADNPDYHFHLGLAYAQAGEDAKARAALNKALQLNPKFAGADEAKKTLATLVY